MILITFLDKPHVNKDLRSAIMKRSRLKNEANKAKSLDDIISYKKKRNLVVNLNEKTKFEYLANLIQIKKGYLQTIFLKQMHQ